MTYDFEPLMPVLGRDHDEHHWELNLFSYIDTDDVYMYHCISNKYKQCIPYQEHMAYLINSTQEPDFKDTLHVGMLVAASIDGETWYPAVITSVDVMYDSTIGRDVYEVESLGGCYSVPFIDNYQKHFK